MLIRKSNYLLSNKQGLSGLLLVFRMGLLGVQIHITTGLVGLFIALHSEVSGLHYFAYLRRKLMQYPIKIKKQPDNKSVLVSVPDLLGCQENAESIDVAMIRIKEAISSHLTILAEYGESIPHPQLITQHIEKNNDNEIIWAIVDNDINPFLGRSHKINVTLPELLIKQIDDQVNKQPSYKTRSGFIAKACIAELAAITKNS